MKTTSAEAWQILRSAEEVCSATAVRAAVKRMAREINSRIHDSVPLVLTVMRGSVVFTGHLLPLLHSSLEFDYVDVTRYRNATVGGELAWNVTPRTSVDGRVVLVLDDILDEGHTLAAIRENLLQAGARSFYSAVFAEKRIEHPRTIEADFVGIHVPNRYVFGFGMDVKGFWRNLPAVYALPNG